MTTKNRQLKDEDIENAKRLKRVWESRKDVLGLTEDDMNELCGWKRTSTAFNQYKNGGLALNLDALLKIAKVLHVHPAEIMPSIEQYLPEESLGKSHIKRFKDAFELACVIIDMPVNERSVIERIASSYKKAA